MDVLVLGGTSFVGRAFTDAALAAGHAVTLFNRGQTNPGLFPQAHHVRGDRATDLDRLDGMAFDAVVDPSGYHPVPVRQAVATIKHELYLFVSSISAYADLSKPGVHEGSPLATLEGDVPESFERNNELYGPLKVLCEKVVAEESPCPLVIRPGLIVGPHDYSDRFTYWVSRAARGGTILAPAPPERQVQLIDVRDLAEWMLRLVEHKIHGVFNAVGPAETLSMGHMVDACRTAAGTTPQIEWADTSFLLERDVQPWSEMPLWLPAPENAGIMAADGSAARAAGLTFRPLIQTARDTLEWDRSRPAGPRAAGMEAKREAALLAEWRGRHQSKGIRPSRTEVSHASHGEDEG